MLLDLLEEALGSDPAFRSWASWVAVLPDIVKKEEEEVVHE